MKSLNELESYTKIPKSPTHFSCLLKLKVTIVLVSLFHFSPLAQLDKKTWLINGSGSFSASRTDFTNNMQNTTQESTSINVRVSPSIGFFVIDKLPIGLKASIVFDKDEAGEVYDSDGNAIASGGSSRVSRLNIGPFLRYYFLNKDKQINFFGELAYQYGSDNGFNFNINRNTLLFNAGLEVFFNTSVGLEFSLGYLSVREDSRTISSRLNAFQTGIGFNFHLIK